MKTETLIASKFAEKGVEQNEVILDLDLARYLNNGGSHEKMFERCVEAIRRDGGEVELVSQAAKLLHDWRYRMGSEGHTPRADKASDDLPSASHTDAEKGHLTSAAKANTALPDSAPDGNGKGQPTGADEANAGLPPVSAKMPGHARYSGKTMERVQDVVARSLFDTKLPDGRSYREIHHSEIPHLTEVLIARGMSSIRHARILTAIYQHGKPTDPNATLDQCVTEEKFEEIRKSVEGFNDLH